MQFAFEGMYSLLSGISSLYQKKRLLRGEDQRIRRNSLRIRIGFASMLDQRVPENEVAARRSPEDSQRIRRGFAEDSHVFWRIRVRNPCLLCGFLKDSNETTIPFYNIKR